MAARNWAKRYAQAIYEIATAQDPTLVETALDDWARELRLIGEALDNREFRVFLQHAKVPLARKVEAVREVFSEVSPLARNLLSLIVSRGLVDQVKQVEEEYRHLVDRHRGMERVSVYSAIALEDPEKERIVRFVQEMTDSKAVLDAQVDPSIIGGLVIRIGDKLLDGSTKSKLENLKEELETASI